MRTVFLQPDQIITLNDYPVHNTHILKLYFRMFDKARKGVVPPCPVVSKNRVINRFDSKIRNIFRSFEARNPQAQYFLLDGSHKTTAATLSRKNIYVMVFESDKDIRESEKLAEEGELMSLPIGKTMNELIKALIRHFNKNKHFQTIKEKTDRMIKDSHIPKYMLNSKVRKKI